MGINIIQKNILNDVQNEGKGEINTAYLITLKLYFDTISVERLTSKLFYEIRNSAIPPKNVKLIYLTISDSIYLSMQNAVNTSDSK